MGGVWCVVCGVFDFRILMSIYVLIRLTLVLHSTAFYNVLSL